MIRFVVLDIRKMYAEIIDELYSNDEKDERILKYAMDGFMVVRVTY